MMLIMTGAATYDLPVDYTLCSCHIHTNAWLHLIAQAHKIWAGESLVSVRTILEEVECPAQPPGGFWRGADEIWAFDTIPSMAEWAWKPDIRMSLQKACPAGHVLLMLVCSQKFLLRAASEAGDAQAHIASFFQHLMGIQTVFDYPATELASEAKRV